MADPGPITKKSRGPRVKKLQAGLDRELKHWKFAWRKIKIDGVPGRATFDAANMVGWLQGFSDDELEKIDGGHISQRDVLILIGDMPRTHEMEERSKARRDDAAKLRKKHKFLVEHPDPKPAPAGGSWVMFDNHEVARWMAEILQDARDSGMWNGYVFSGRRSPQYCRELCENICDAPSCSGTCAGESSNHCGPPSFDGNDGEGAVDVTDPQGLRRYCETHNKPLRGGGQVLPRDLPHFSRNGN